ncbi:MAG: hypothetical protein H6999_00525 [Hahellaceae bacterium]|nr:hypothetical protein [Hahellaceae bacterium]MCP5168235.1 hypothetical protein [Hahellaceae bacterium]
MKRTHFITGYLGLTLALAGCQSIKPLAVTDECASPLLYQDKAMSLNASYGILGLGGTYVSTSNVKNVEKQVQIYFAEAEFLCKQHQLGNLSTEQYLQERKTMGREFADIVPGLKAALMPPTETFDADEAWLFSESRNIPFSRVKGVEQLDAEPCADGYTCTTSGDAATGRWQNAYFSCAADALANAAEAQRTEVRGREKSIRDVHTKALIRKESESRQIATLTGTEPNQPNFTLQREINLTEITYPAEARSRKEMKSKLVLDLPPTIVGQNSIRQLSTLLDVDDAFRTKAVWQGLPDPLSSEQLGSFLDLLSAQHIQLDAVTYQDDLLFCRVMVPNPATQP